MERVAVVTGASRGIGLAIARRLASEGCRVVLCARGKTALARAAKIIRHDGGVAHIVSADLTRPASARRLMAEAARHLGRIDILINNVGGLLHDRPFMELSDAHWTRTLNLNLMSAVRACRAVIPHMRKQGGGHIVQIASTAGMRMEARYPDYRIAKAGLIALGEALARDLASDGIRVNTVCPGAVWTSSWEREARQKARRTGVPDEAMARKLRLDVASRIPLARMGMPEDVARVVAFLVAPETTWTTGATFRIDGGGP